MEEEEESNIQEIFSRPHNEFQIKIVESKPSYIIAEEVKTQMVFLRYLSNLDEKTATFVLTCLYYDMGLPKIICVDRSQMNYITEFIKRFPTSNIIWKPFKPAVVSEEVDSLIKKHLKEHMTTEELKFMLAKIQLFLNSTPRIGSACAFDLFYRKRIPVGKKEPINFLRSEQDDSISNGSSETSKASKDSEDNSPTIKNESGIKIKLKKNSKRKLLDFICQLIETDDEDESDSENKRKPDENDGSEAKKANFEDI